MREVVGLFSRIFALLSLSAQCVTERGVSAERLTKVAKRRNGRARWVVLDDWISGKAPVYVILC